MPVLLAANFVTVGANAVVTASPTAAPTIALGSGGVDAQPASSLGDVWSRGPVALRDRVLIHGKVHASNVLLGNGAVVDGGIDRAPVLDPLTTLQWTVHWPTGAAPNITLGVGASGSFAPGAYGSVTAASGAKLRLSTGTYYFSSLDLEPNAVAQLVQDKGSVIIYVAGNIIYRGSFAATDGSPPDLLLASISNTTVLVEAPFSGALLAPKAQLTLRFGTHTGYFAANSIAVDANAIVRYRAPNSLFPAASVRLQDCATQLAPRTDLTGKAREVAYQKDVARYCSMPGTDACKVNIAARTNVDEATVAFSLFGQAITPATFLAVTRDRIRKEQAAADDPVLAALICSTPDQDGDLVPDSRDQCANTPPLTATFDNGCIDPAVPDAPAAADVNQLIANGAIAFDPRCSGASALPDSIAGAFYRPAQLNRGTYIVAGRVTNQPNNCSVWYEFDIEEYNSAGPQRRYQVAFGQTEELTALVGLSKPVPSGFIQFNPLPVDLGTRGLLGSVGGKNGVRFRVRTMNGGGMRSDWSDWKVTTVADCVSLGFYCPF